LRVLPTFAPTFEITPLACYDRPVRTPSPFRSAAIFLGRAALQSTCALCLAVGACSVFDEIPLEGEESSDASDSPDESGETSPCDTSRCLNQDTMRACPAGSTQPTELDCSLLCESQINISCVRVSTSDAGCWCVAPNAYDVTSCKELEACLDRCGSEITGECGLRCFSLANAPTGRLYGALLSCAQLSCDALCVATPESCATCVANALAGASGPCALQRSACDNDLADGM
jgi:hypothetical protein